MKNTVAEFTVLSDNRISIFVSSEYANSFYDFLKTKKIQCTPPSEAMFKKGRAYIDSSGRKQLEDEAIDHEIIAEGTIEEATEWLNDWDLPNI